MAGIFLAVVGLGAGMKPGGGDKGVTLGGGMKPTIGGRAACLEWGDLEGVERREAMLVGFVTGALTSCTSGPALAFLSSTSFSSFFSFGSTSSSFFSFFFSDSNFSRFSSLRSRGRTSLVLPRTIRFVNPCEMSSLSSILMASCLKENAGIAACLETKAGDAALAVSAAGALSDRCVGAAASPSSVDKTFLTTRRTTFTTFFRVRPWSSAVSAWLTSAVPLAKLLPPTPFCSLSLFKTGSDAALGGSGLLIFSAPLDGGSGLLKRSGTLTGDLTLGGEGLLTRAAEVAGNAGGGLLARNNPLPGSKAGTDADWLDSPLLSGYSWKRKRGGVRTSAARGGQETSRVLLELIHLSNSAKHEFKSEALPEQNGHMMSSLLYLTISKHSKLYPENHATTMENKN